MIYLSNQIANFQIDPKQRFDTRARTLEQRDRHLVANALKL